MCWNSNWRWKIHWGNKCEKYLRYCLGPLKSYCVQSKLWSHCEKQNGNKKLDVKKKKSQNSTKNKAKWPLIQCINVKEFRKKQLIEERFGSMKKNVPGNKWRTLPDTSDFLSAINLWYLEICTSLSVNIDVLFFLVSMYVSINYKEKFLSL